MSTVDNLFAIVDQAEDQTEQEEEKEPSVIVLVDGGNVELQQEEKADAIPKSCWMMSPFLWLWQTDGSAFCGQVPSSLGYPTIEQGTQEMALHGVRGFVHPPGSIKPDWPQVSWVSSRVTSQPYLMAKH